MRAKIKIANLPTPIEEMVNLTRFINGPSLFIKRDDLTGLAFGGNKTRKLEYLLADALNNGARTLITAGSVQSNHCRQTAAAAARFGLGCELILTGDQPSTPSGNLLLDQLFGAVITWVPNKSDREKILNESYLKCLADEKTPYLIPYGGSNAIGAMGYSQAMQELLDQDTAFDWIVFASSSGGTQAGLVFGARKFHYSGKVLGISIEETRETLQVTVAKTTNQMAENENAHFSFQPAEILVNSDYCGPGYGVYGDLERYALHLFAEQEGILLDPVYTGRAAGGLLDLISKGFFKKTDRVLFWHTGGQPALFASAYTGTI